ncbi:MULTISPECIES: murein hydrolase activator EnvC family protein [Metabacillus]|uniref:murein hydrolase activator EnvC family protein n=1 Tax=Metabacillus TaxID=2675233 RepID=UPI001B91B30C|nr:MULTISPECIES: peptidoglycan DD-metalloendopeptidase family protein [Metabacillus]
MSKKILSLGLVALLGTSTLVIPTNSNTVFANTELEQKKENIHKKRSGVDSSIQKKRSEISNLEQKQKSLDSEIKLLDSKMTETNEQLRQSQGKIEETKEKIDELNKQIREVEERIEERNRLLKDRVRSIQESGGVVSYLDVLLGSQDFSDFVSRVSAVTTIVNADKEIIQEHKEDIKLLEESEVKLNNELNKLAAAITELQSLKQQLKSQVAEKSIIMEQVKNDQIVAEKELYKLEDEVDFLKEQEATIKIEMKRQQGLKDTTTTASNRSTTPSTNGSFMWPAKGTFTSGYGARWGRLHAGVDLANSADNVPIVASADGTVIRSYYSSSYGNVVFISHNINGKIFTTLYAHMDSRLVSSGQSVSKGQQIGYMGNTGRSTGKHLHFEIHDGAWKNPINPMKYLP